MVRLLFVAPIFTLALLPIYFVFFKTPPPLPDLDLDAWWGPPNLKAKQDDSIRPLKIKFKEEMIQDLREHIRITRTFTPPLEGVGFEYGFNSKQLDSWLKYWAEEYPFAERQKAFNQFQNYRTNIQGLNIHFISVRPEVPPGVELVPVLLIHGWPGSVREFFDAIPLLTAVTEGRDFALEVIVPALPGYGFSDAAVRPGLGAPEMAVVLRNLMQRLGYKQFYVQGGDWGALIGSNMATLFPKEVLGFHTNFPVAMSTATTLISIVAAWFPSLIVEPKFADRMYPLADFYSFMLEETGYMHLQSTKPDSVGVALSDSPAGLLAYVLEKFSTWTDPGNRRLEDGGLSTHFTKEQLIDNLMFYWATNSITTSMRLYSETFNRRWNEYALHEIPTSVPTWGLQARYEIAYQPSFLIKFKFTNLVNVTTLDNGGHFLAFELPQIFAEDVLKAVGEFRKWHKTNQKTEL